MPDIEAVGGDPVTLPHLGPLCVGLLVLTVGLMVVAAWLGW